MKSDSLKGVYVPLATAFDANGRVNVASMQALTRFVLDHGAHGVITAGSTGEFFGLGMEDRKILLNELAIYIKETLTTKKEVQLVFICTHNSRRSHMAQIWAQTAAFYYDIRNIHTYSGGTQKTAFNSSAVKALQEVGFKISVI